MNVVTLADQTTYMVDVGYGGDGPTNPLPLAAGVVTPNTGTQEMRLLYGNMPGLTHRQKNLWTYQFRNATDQPWKSGYAFYEIEFYQRDFEVMNFYTSQNRSCFLTYHLLVIKFLQREGKVYGKIILDQNKVKENVGGKNILIKICETEEERVKVLHDYFGISLTRDEKCAIRGKPSALSC